MYRSYHTRRNPAAVFPPSVSRFHNVAKNHSGYVLSIYHTGHQVVRASTILLVSIYTWYPCTYCTQPVYLLYTTSICHTSIPAASALHTPSILGISSTFRDSSTEGIAVLIVVLAA